MNEDFDELDRFMALPHFKEVLRRQREAIALADESMPPKMSWPNYRGFFKVCELHARNNRISLDTQPNLLPLLNELPENPVVVDLGMGNGRFLTELAGRLSKQCKLYGVSATPEEVNKRLCRYAGIEVICGKLNNDPAVIDLLGRLQGSVDKVFDTYGPVTYSNNPLHSLIYAAILLKEGGKFSAMTSTEGDMLSTVFGDKRTRQKITTFFKEFLDIDIKFEFSSINSVIAPGKMEDLLVTFTKGEKELKAEDYLKLCRDADRLVGSACVSKASWFSFKDFRIAMRDYEPFPTSNQEGCSSSSTSSSFSNS